MPALRRVRRVARMVGRARQVRAAAETEDVVHEARVAHRVDLAAEPDGALPVLLQRTLGPLDAEDATHDAALTVGADGVPRRDLAPLAGCIRDDDANPVAVLREVDHLRPLMHRDTVESRRRRRDEGHVLVGGRQHPSLRADRGEQHLLIGLLPG